MNFLHYLYAKGETTLNYRLNGRSLISFPIVLYTLFFGFPLLPHGLNEFVVILIFLCWYFILYALTYIVIPPKKGQIKNLATKVQ